jgi:hypothetical protein
MVARRKARRTARKKSFNISAIETGTALSLMQSTGAASAIDEAMKGNVKGALTTLQSNVQSNKQIITATLAGAFVAKALTKGFGSTQIAKLGPVRIKI